MSSDKVKRLAQYLTPSWASELLVQQYYSGLTSKDVVIEPACGRGSFLRAIPDRVLAIGIDIDPEMVSDSIANTGRRVLLGDFANIEIDVTPTLILGNPPFSLDVVDSFLDRSYELLEEGGRVGFLLPTYAFQTAARVAAYADKWSLAQDMIPRNIYEGLTLPLMFARFTKEQHRTMVGFSLYREMADVQKLPKDYRDQISEGGGSVWLNAVTSVLKKLGGKADLSAIYTEFEGKRPTKTKFWREQIRKVLRRYEDVFVAHGDGRYALSVVAI